jgi:diguanylate cyclase (GGDEF)-like protein
MKRPSLLKSLQNLNQSPKILWGSLTFLFAVLSLYLFYRDAQFIFDERSQRLYQTSEVVAQLLPQNTLEEAALAKDQNLPVLALLSETLLTLRDQLKLKGDLSLIHRENQSFRLVSSTDPDRQLGDTFALSPKLERSAIGRRFADEFEWNASATTAMAVLPLGESELFLVTQSHEGSIFFRIANLAFHYLLLIGGLGILFSAWVMMQHQQLRRRLDRAEMLISQIFENSQSRFAILDSTGHLTLANPALLNELDLSFDEVEGLSPFEPNDVFNILPIDQSMEDLLKKTKEKRSFRAKVRILGGAKNDRPAEILFLFQDTTRELLLLIEDLRPAAFSEVTGSSLEAGEFVDSETGIPKFSFLKSMLETQWEEFRKSESCLLFVDLDDFQSLQKQHGSELASNLIREFAHYLKKFFRHSDLVVRLKQDQFLILLPKTKLGSASTIANNLLAQAKASNQDRALFSVGVAPLHELDHFDDWVARAYAAVKNAKLAGKGCVEVQTADAIQIEA